MGQDIETTGKQEPDVVEVDENAVVEQAHRLAHELRLEHEHMHEKSHGDEHAHSKMERCMGIQHMENSTHMSMDIIIQIPRLFPIAWHGPSDIWRQSNAWWTEKRIVRRY